MKYSLIPIACLVLAQAASAQSVYSTEQIITNVLRTGIWEGQVDKRLRTEGDAAAVVLTKVIAGRDVSRGEVDTMLDMLLSSFSELGLIESAAEREPRTALFLLRYFDCVVYDAALKKKIADTRKSILAAFAKFKTAEAGPFAGLRLSGRNKYPQTRSDTFVPPHVSVRHYESRQLSSADRDRPLARVGNEAQVSEAIHKETHSGSGCANHFRQLHLTDFRNDLLRFAAVAEVSK